MTFYCASFRFSGKGRSDRREAAYAAAKELSRKVIIEKNPMRPTGLYSIGGVWHKTTSFLLFDSSLSAAFIVSRLASFLEPSRDTIFLLDVADATAYTAGKLEYVEELRAILKGKLIVT